MSCGTSTHKTCHDKSCQRFYNNNNQALAANSTIQLVIGGTSVVDNGISIKTEPQNYRTLKTGLYHFAGDVTILATANGAVNFQIFMDGVALPCTKRTANIYNTGFTTIHTETDLCLDGCCCDVSHTFTYQITSDASASGTVVEFCSGVLKLA